MIRVFLRKKVMKEWEFAGLADRRLASRLEMELKDHKKKNLKSFGNIA